MKIPFQALAGLTIQAQTQKIWLGLNIAMVSEYGTPKSILILCVYFQYFFV